MPYIDKAYILTFITEEDLQELTNDDDANLVNAIARADDKINSYVVNQTTVPLADVPDMIKGISLDLAVYYLHSRTQSNNVPDMVMRKYEDAIFTLKDISAGRAKLNFTTEPKPDQLTSIEINGDDLKMSRDMF